MLAATVWIRWIRCHSQFVFDEIVRQAAEELIHLPDAARAEVWVSAVFGGWRQAGVADGLDPEAIDRELFDHLRADPSEAGLAIALAATSMDISGADALVGHLRSAGMREPYWHEIVGTAQPTGAWIVHDSEVDADSIIIEFVHDDGLGHSLLVELDHGAAVDVLFGPDGLVKTLELDGERSLRVEAIDVSDAAGRVRSGFDQTAKEADPAVTEEFGMNVVLAIARLRRLGSEGAVVPAITTQKTTVIERDPEADAYASATLEAALRTMITAEPPAGFDTAVEAFDVLLADGDPDVLLLLAEADHPVAPGQESYLAAAGAYVTPGPLAAFARPHRELIEMLEWADWLGAVIQLVRSGPGTPITPATLVDGINRCPEVVDTIPKAERRAVETAFDLVLHAWSATGIVDNENALTTVGAWVLPQALLFAWRPKPSG